MTLKITYIYEIILIYIMRIIISQFEKNVSSKMLI